MKIAYVGREFGTSLHRAMALQHLGHRVIMIDPWSWLSSKGQLARVMFHTGYLGSNMFIGSGLKEAISSAAPDLVWVNQGEFLGPASLRTIREVTDAPVVNYANDDPFGVYGRRRFWQYRRALSLYDLVVVVREVNVKEAYEAGARKVLRVWMAADEVAHSPRELREEDKHRYGSDVCFVGTWMRERGSLMVDLIRRGVPLAIWGDNWQKAPEWLEIKKYWRGGGVYDRDEYARLIQSSRICLGLISKGNRDMHTTRSLEIPALGSLLCAERTSEHQALYEEGSEAMFWKDAEECAALCFELLADEPRRLAIAAAGRRRALKNDLFNASTMEKILAEI